MVVTASSVVLTGGALATTAASGTSAQLDASAAGDFHKPKDVVNDSTTKYRKGEPAADYFEHPDDPSSITVDSATSAAGGSGGSADAQSIEMDPSDDTEDAELVGETKLFYTSGPDGYAFKQFTAVSVGDNVEVWVARNMSFPAADDPRQDPVISEEQAEALTEQFDERMYDPEVEVFGKPKARDGINSTLSQLGLFPEDYYNTGEGSGDRTILLVDNIRDENYYDSDYPVYIAGYYSSTVQDYSNRNIVNVDSYGWDDVNETDRTVGYEGTLAHEFQHLIHNDLDADETTWVNEGMSDYAEVVTGYGVSEGHVTAYEEIPYNSLTNWEDQGAINVLADYGIAFAFQMYLDDQYGQEFISNLAQEDANGIAGVEKTLDEVGAKRDFYELYQDFSTAVVLDDVDKPNKDEYDIDGIDLEVNTSEDVGTAGAWGTNYQEIDVADKGPVKSVSVTGTEFIGTKWQTATDPVTGEGDVLYSGSGNLLDRHAIVEADLSEGDSTLTYETYYDIESTWDYGFVQVSTDGGETWESVETDEMSSELADGAHPTVEANVPGYTGTSDGWVEQSVDLSEYEGEGDVLVSFRYATDWAFIQPGMYVKNVQVAGEDVATDSTEPYMSLREATGDNVEYQFTFIGIKQNGNYKVKQLDMRTFDENGEQDLKQFLHNGNFETVIVASTWAAGEDESGRVPVGAEFTFAGENEEKGNDGKQKGHEK
ncbi:peptidase M6 [Halogranum rubrum]